MRPPTLFTPGRGLDGIRRAIPQALKEAAAGVLCSKPVGGTLRAIFNEGIPHRGHRILVDHHRVSATMVAFIYFGIYERAEIDLVAQFLPRDCDVVELGASLGVNSCNIASKLMPGCRLISVEADPVLADLAARTMARNGYDGTANVVCAAVDYSGMSRTMLYRGDDTLSANTLGVRGAGGEIEVETITLRQILDDHAIDDYSLVTDIEGAELALLLNEEEALKRCRAIIMEIAPCSFRGEFYSRDRIRDAIIAHGFVEAYAYGSCAAFLRNDPASPCKRTGGAA
jgi:FkbM family methyltransferase